MPEPLRILLSPSTLHAHRAEIDTVLRGQPWQPVLVPDEDDPRTVDAEVAFVSRDVTGLSTKHEIQPGTQRFYTAMLDAPSLRWVHTHSAGADRAIFGQLRQRGVSVTTSSGANAGVVAQTALAGLLALARHFPQLIEAQRQQRWAPLIGSGLPRDLQGQHAVIVGWGPIGQQIGNVLRVLGLSVTAVRQRAAPAGDGIASIAFEQLPALLPRTDWLILACPLTDRTRGLIDARAMALLPAGARLLNVARGEVVHEDALIEALRSGHLGGAYLDVYAHEPLDSTSPLWTLPNVIATPHSAGFSDGNAARVVEIFLDNLRRWQQGEPLRNRLG